MTTRRRWAMALAIALFACAASLSIESVRVPILRTIGWVLVIDDPVISADVVVIAVDAYEEGVLDAADLVHEGIAARVAVFPQPPTNASEEFVRRGVSYEDAAGQAVRQLEKLGISDIDIVQRSVSGTEEIGVVLPEWCRRRGIRTAVVVTTPDHSRRLRRVLERAARGSEISFRVRASRYAEFDPDTWWRSRVGARTMIVELQKLLFDWVRHPF